MTPLLLQQFRIYYADRPMPAAVGQAAGEAAPQPLGVVFWGFVDAEVEGRLKAGNAKLRPQDWRSGDRLWVIDVLAPFGAGDDMVKDLKLKLFPDRPLNLLTVNGGQLTAKVV